MNHNQEPLVNLPIEKWPYIQKIFKSDFPRGLPAYKTLETQKLYKDLGFDYGFQVYCPFGEVEHGMVAINEKDVFYEVVIQSPKDNTKILEDALRKSKIINWKKNVIVPFAPSHIRKCLKNIIYDVNVNMEELLGESFCLYKDKSYFHVSLPSGFRVDLLTHDHIGLVNSKWPHKYPGSEWYFQLLINMKSGYGLFKERELVSWLFINESGAIGHMYTLEEYRRKGYAEELLKLVCNDLLKEGKDIVLFCVKGNDKAVKLYLKAGFQQFDCGIAWCYLNSKIGN